MKTLVQGRSQYSDEDRRSAVIEYFVHGVMTKVSDVTGIPKTTLAGWKNQSDWWHELALEVQDEVREHIHVQNLRIATKAGERVMHSLEHGDEKLVWDKKKEKHVIKRVKPTAKDSMVIDGIAQDKAQRYLGLPTEIHAKTADEFTKSFIEEFTQIAQTFKEKQARVVSTQGSDDEA